MSKSKTWTKHLIQQHAHVAVAVELYTLPFYLTTLTSIQDPKDPIYKTILSVCIEEMVHLQLAANLCLALDTKPHFKSPKYGVTIPYLKPDDPATNHHALINAKLGPLNEDTLQIMLDIETPSELEGKTQNHTTPQYPYKTLGDLYDALLYGIETIGANQFSWNTSHQQTLVTHGKNYDQNSLSISQTIGNLEQAQDAIDLIKDQGEGKVMTPVPQPPYKEMQFPVSVEHQITHEKDDPQSLGQYSHFGRFIWVQNYVNQNGFPTVYTTTGQENGLATLQKAALYTLMIDFAALIDDMNTLWNTGKGDIWKHMTVLINDAKNCWQSGVVPRWTP